MLTSGIFGTISSLTDERIHLEIAPGLQVEVVRWRGRERSRSTPTPEVDGA